MDFAARCVLFIFGVKRLARRNMFKTNLKRILPRSNNKIPDMFANWPAQQYTGIFFDICSLVWGEV